MSIERTLSIVKPDGVARGLIGEILRRYEAAGLVPIAMKMLRLDPESAGRFYAVHRERPFFADLVRYMSSGPVVVSVLEGEGAVARHRALLGATDPAKAEPGTVRRDFGTSIEANVVHGSDAPATAAEEIAFFFSRLELCPR